MRKYLVLMITAVFMWVSTYAQSPVDVVTKALNGTNAQNILKYFDSNLSVSTDNGQSTYSKAQAENVVKNFLTKNAVKLFTVSSAGVRNESSFFVIGDVSGSRGRYKVYLSFKQKGKVSVLQDVRFDLLRD